MRRKRGIDFKMSQNFIVIFLLLFGVILILVSSIEFDSPYNWWKYWGKSMAQSVGSVLLSSGLISLLMEISTIQNNVSTAIYNLLKGDIDFSCYSKKELIKIVKKVAIARCETNITEKDLNNSFYKYEKNLVDLLNDAYYDYHNCKTVLYPDSENQVFKKKVEIEYKLINKSKKDLNIVFNWKIHESKLKNKTEVLDKFKVKYLKICGNEFSDHEIDRFKTIEPDKKENGNTYDYIITLRFPYRQEEKYTVKCKLEYEIPYSDVTQIYKMTRPCKNFLHEFFIKKDSAGKDVWRLKGNAFASFFCMQEEVDSKFKVEQAIDESVKISFKEWSLPGAGYVILSEKN